EGIPEADRNHDGKVSLSELIRYLNDKVPDATNDKQHPDEIVKIKDWAKEVMADLSARGIALGGWKPMPPTAFVTKSFGPLPPPYMPQPYSVPPDEADLERLIALEDQGQQVMLRYLQGDEISQTRDDFRNGRDLYQQALALAPGSLYIESRKEFFLG